MTVEDDGWAARMADRARERRAEREAEEKAQLAREWDRTYGNIEREEWARVAGMTLGEATEQRQGPGWACACRGSPFCCRYSWMQAAALNRAAHIVAKLLADVAGGSAA